MSRTLNLCDHLLSQGRHFHTLGVDDRALRTFTHLARFRELPREVAEETQIHLAELLLKHGRFAEARRHLTAALTHDADNPEYHHLMASAHRDDPRGDKQTALEHFRRCVALQADNPWYLCDAGQVALELEETDEGLDYLRRAVEAAPDDAMVVADVVRGMVAAGEHDEARRTARAALFRNGGAPAFQQIWNDVRFQELHHRQQRAHRCKVVRQAVAEGRVLLPFHELTEETPTGRKLVRRDAASRTPAPHYLRLAARSGRKHA
jgi:predicted Zn-dependent protease